VIINITCGTPKFSFNVQEDYRFAKENIWHVLKMFGVKPIDITGRNWKIKFVGGADLDMSKSLAANGVHGYDPDMGLADYSAAIPGVTNPNTYITVKSKELEIYDPADGAYEPPLQTLTHVAN